MPEYLTTDYYDESNWEFTDWEPVFEDDNTDFEILMTDDEPDKLYPPPIEFKSEAYSNIRNIINSAKSSAISTVQSVKLFVCNCLEHNIDIIEMTNIDINKILYLYHRFYHRIYQNLYEKYLLIKHR